MMTEFSFLGELSL